MELYRDFDLWRASIENGRRILAKRMFAAQQTRALAALFGETNLHLDALRQTNHYRRLAWQETLLGLEGRARALHNKRLAKREARGLANSST